MSATETKTYTPIGETPPTVAERWHTTLLGQCSEAKAPASAIDPQCGYGSLLSVINPGSYSTIRIGLDVDGRSGNTTIHKTTASCARMWEVMADIYDKPVCFTVGVAVPPTCYWKLPDGRTRQAGLATWEWLTTHARCGYVVIPERVVTECHIKDSPHYMKSIEITFPAGSVYAGADPDMLMRVCFFQNPGVVTTPSYQLRGFINQAAEVVDAERKGEQKFNVMLHDDGSLKCAVTKRQEAKGKLDVGQIAILRQTNGTHPLALTTDRSDRDLLRTLAGGNGITISDEAALAIRKALEEAEEASCPIMPVTDYEAVAYADEMDELKCIKSVSEGSLSLTAGKPYKVTPFDYRFQHKFKRTKPHFDEDTGKTIPVEHDCILFGKDRGIGITGDKGYIQFMERPSRGNQFEEASLWEFFERPVVRTVADRHPERVKANETVLASCEMIGNYSYMPGQREYLARIACKDSGIVAAETGTGKTLMAISLLAMKGPRRCLIVAPQAGVRSDNKKDDDDDWDGGGLGAAQWLQEIQKFAPYLRVYELFSPQDLARLRKNHNGTLPPGVYISYYEAMFLNGAKESLPASWKDEQLDAYGARLGLGKLPPRPQWAENNEKHWCKTVGEEQGGIRCIMEPCLATLVGHEFDMVIMDEAHRIANLSAITTQMAIRMQPKYRWGLTATPITNVITNLFSLMGWVAVDRWYKGGERSAGWPFARHEVGRFTDSFQATERDLTEEARRRQADWKWRGTCQKSSPVISSPARLLKLIKPWMAFISKDACNPNYRPATITDIRVPMGVEQAKLYGYFTERKNLPGGGKSKPLAQQSVLRNICADPAGYNPHNDPNCPAVTSNLNPKVIAIMELVGRCIREGEQVLIINSRLGLSNEIASRLDLAGVSYGRIDSTVPAKRHAVVAQAFKDRKFPVCLMGIKCAAMHSFSKVKYEVIGSIEYSPGPFNQAKGRIDRVDSDRDREIFCVLTQNSIEEIMFDGVATKDDAATLCLRGRKVPRDYKPVSPEEVLVDALKRFQLDGATPESECETGWLKLVDELKQGCQVQI